MATLQQCISDLERRKIPFPRLDKEVYQSTTYRGLAEEAKGSPSVASWLKEMSAAQRPELWNVFMRNRGKLFFFEESDYDCTPFKSSGYSSGIKRNPKTGKSTISFEIFHSAALHTAGYANLDLFHELGHMIDDRMFLSRKTESDMGFHSENDVWQWLACLDKKIFPKGEVSQIEDNRRGSNYLSATPEWSGEVFAEAVNRHMGPKRLKSEYQANYWTVRKRDAVYSPFIQSYMDRIVTADIAIQLQDKPYAECQRDRAKLQAILHRPLDAYFDLEAIRRDEGRLREAGSETTKGIIIEALGKQVEAGLQRITDALSSEIGTTIAPFSSHSRAS